VFTATGRNPVPCAKRRHLRMRVKADKRTEDKTKVHGARAPAPGGPKGPSGGQGGTAPKQAPSPVLLPESEPFFRETPDVSPPLPFGIGRPHRVAPTGHHRSRTEEEDALWPGNVCGQKSPYLCVPRASPNFLMREHPTFPPPLALRTSDVLVGRGGSPSVPWRYVGWPRGHKGPITAD